VPRSYLWKVCSIGNVRFSWKKRKEKKHLQQCIDNVVAQTHSVTSDQRLSDSWLLCRRLSCKRWWCGPGLFHCPFFSWSLTILSFVRPSVEHLHRFAPNRLILLYRGSAKLNNIDIFTVFLFGWFLFGHQFACEQIETYPSFSLPNTPQSVQHENMYRNPRFKYCYGESLPELLSEQ